MENKEEYQLVFKDITKTYGSKQVLKSVSGAVPHGRITSLIGPNGAGKSTLLSIMSRLLQEDSGKMLFRDREVKKYKTADLSKQLSILKQSNHTELRLKVRDLVAMGRFPYAKGRLSATDWKKVDEAIAFANMEDMQQAYIDELSGGQKQRAFIAMIIAQDTEYILLDEPLNNLDMKHSVQVMKMLRRLVDEMGKTVVIVIHEINFAAQYSDHIIVLKDGELKHSGHVDEVIQAGVLRDVFEIEFDIVEKNCKRICNYFNL